MKKFDNNDLFPSMRSAEFEKAKNESPYSVLLEYSNAFNEMYTGKLQATVTESFQLRTKSMNNEPAENFVIALYFQASIGSGYLYRLMEVEQLKSEAYPVRVKVFQNVPGTLGTYKDYNSFDTDIIKFLGSSFVKMLIINLLTQVELYNESRSGK